MKKGRFTTVILVIIFLAGLSLLLYPSVSNYWNSFHQSRAIARYSEKVAELSEEEYKAILQEAVEYNKYVSGRGYRTELTDYERTRYESVLNINGDGLMGVIEIPKIDVTLPVYHGTSDGVLQIAAGHLEWSSLPVGGESSHCVLSGHRGLPSAKLFTHLDEMIEGDIFMLRILDEIYTYEVDQILIVEPENTESLQIVPGKDYCTLVTCTPYGINTHRLLVRGHRIANMDDALGAHITSEAIQIEPLIVASVIGIPILLIMTIFVFLRGGKKKEKKKDRKNKKVKTGEENK